jgi:hypothetical protein
MYVARFFYLLHALDVPTFPSLQFFDLTLRGVVPVVFAATDQEALNLGEAGAGGGREGTGWFSTESG